MTWGPLFIYYCCPECGMKYKYELDKLAAFGDTFGQCPHCGTDGTYEKEGPRLVDDKEYSEVD